MSRKIWILLIAFLVYVFAGIASALLYIYFCVKTPLKLPSVSVEFKINKGDTAEDIIERLYQLGYLKYPLAAKVYLKLTNKDIKLKPGVFAIEIGENFVDFIDKVLKHKTKIIRIVVFEGMDSFDIAKLLKRERIIKNKNEFLNIVHNETSAAQFGLYGKSLEGYLFPDTYFFELYMRPIDVIKKMIENYKLQAQPLLKKSKILSPYETLIIASIIQKETYVKREMPIIAAVFYNRLKKNMPLQADPTIIYAIKLKTKGWTKKRLRKRDLRIRSPYNTYIHNRLPPTPICNPGLDAIKAALNPAKVKFLYFVSKGDGTHYFSSTLKEHNRAVYKYQIKKKRRRKRSSRRR